MSPHADIPAPPPDGGEDQRFFFIHIQKTGGTSLRQHLLANFDRAVVYPPKPEKGVTKSAGLYAFLTYYLLGKELVDLPAAEQARYRLFHGHMPYAVTQLLSFTRPITTLTVLREPVARTLSVLGQKKQHNPLYKDATFEEIYDDRNIFEGEIHNHQAKVFAVPNDSNLLSGYDHFPVGPAELEVAKRNLDNVDVIGLQSDLPSFLAELERRFGWVSLQTAPRKNVGMERKVSQAFTDRIAAENEIDVAFYQYAVDLVKSRNS
jgi:Sulfotransferase domain